MGEAFLESSEGVAFNMCPIWNQKPCSHCSPLFPGSRLMVGLEAQKWLLKSEASERGKSRALLEDTFEHCWGPLASLPARLFADKMETFSARRGHSSPSLLPVSQRLLR